MLGGSSEWFFKRCIIVLGSLLILITVFFYCYYWGALRERGMHFERGPARATQARGKLHIP